MRLLGRPDKPFEPRNSIETKICDVLKVLSGQEIRSPQTRKEYKESHWDAQDNSIDPGFDYIIQTSNKEKEYYLSGLEFGVDVDDDAIVKIDEIGVWNT